MFTDEFVYDDSPSGITIPVMLSYGATDILVSAKVDTGAQVCLFSHEDVIYSRHNLGTGLL